MESSTPTLTLTAQQVTQVRDHLLQDDELERVAYIYCSQSGDNRLLAEEISSVFIQATTLLVPERSLLDRRR